MREKLGGCLQIELRTLGMETRRSFQQGVRELGQRSPELF